MKGKHFHTSLFMAVSQASLRYAMGVNMDKHKDFQDILNGSSILNLLFAQIRIVNIHSNRICQYVDGKIIESDIYCYSIWNHKKICSNCTSRRAFFEQKQIVKLQYVGNTIFLVISFPFQFKEKAYVMELIKDISDSLDVHDTIHNDNIDILKMVDNFNLLAVKDPFTDLYNKRYIEMQLENDMADAQMKQESLILVMIDIDHFKKVNDSFGHVVGDIVIKELVRIIHERTDELDCWAARYGGDEFLLVFHGESIDNVKKYCEWIKKEINDIKFNQENHSFHVTVTAGIYLFNPTEDNYITLLDKVDRKMYMEKMKKK